MVTDLHETISQAKKGDQAAFRQLVTAYKGSVFRHAFALLNDRMEAEDVTQEAFVKAYYSLPKLENEYAFVSWLTKVTTNLCYDKNKKIAKKKAAETEELNENITSQKGTFPDRTNDSENEHSGSDGEHSARTKECVNSKGNSRVFLCRDQRYAANSAWHSKIANQRRQGKFKETTAKGVSFMSEHIGELLSSYIDDEVSEIERDWVERHLENCLKCKSEYLQLIKIHEQFQAAYQMIEIPDGIEKNVFARIQQNRAPSSFSLFTGASIFILVAFSFGIMAALGPFATAGIYIVQTLFSIGRGLVFALSSLLTAVPYMVGAISAFMLVVVALAMVILRVLVHSVGKTAGVEEL
ncbi:sigma-70 family RNA polymerase sigma factor [Neobacillus sp. SM06]|uniref:sigma-70 family RNA polymerase sigma factor n=1 Tax=Neobacillus sp. SM06 TaxID=3422492 RepID=UPI003D2B34C3